MTRKLFTDIADIIVKRMTEQGVPSLAVAVAENGKIIWQQAFGWADREKRLPATEHTLYCLASVSKPYTATALMKLVEQGKVDLDAPVNYYLHRDAGLKVWIGEPKEVTVRRVAYHTAGLPTHSHFLPGIKPPAQPDMDEAIRRYGNIVTLPGERYCYSNFGYGILGHIISRVSGMSFSDYLRAEIFLPLGMTRSALQPTPELGAFTAVGYGENGQRITSATCDHQGASSIYSSVHDLLRFGLAHLEQLLPDQAAVLSRESLTTMQTPGTSMGKVNPLDINLRHTSRYGIGWVVDDDELDCRVSHGGGMNGWAAKLLLLPRENIVIAVVANTFKPLAYTVEKDILNTLLPGYAARLAAYEKKYPRISPAAPAPFSPPRELLGDWRGTVHTCEADLPITLSFKTSGAVHARLGTQLETLVNEPVFRDGWFSGKMAGNVFTADTTCHPPHPFHHLRLDIKLRNGADAPVLSGAIIAVAGAVLNHWVELVKCPSSPGRKK